ncbi:efflux transporter outer membrane subunit [Rhodocytophaga rosea]|uniref:Efflux transporter outer membrane subunit n=1 Tax=Rhodocytophaga rosea TaxID=2704465 RepID=A0A6C0GRC3_9BACT|nr:efflux transporter outer membrane subunit [Rhodocytophaga rosea]QHT70621.1 efflux transporter outer membrane subunit [Rhodocytophaga rosea]
MKRFNIYIIGALLWLHASLGFAQSGDIAAEKWKWQSASSQTAAIPKDNQWWKVFNDSTLDSLIELGLANNLDLKAIMSRLDEARTRVKVAQSYYLPSVRLSPYVATQNLAPNRPVAIQLQDGQQLSRFTLNTYQIPLDVSYELDIWQRIGKQVQVNQLLAQATEAEQQTVRLIVTSEIARIYLLLRTTDTEKFVLERSMKLRDSTLAVVQERFKAGLITQMDVQRAETEVANIRVQLQGIQRSRTELELSIGVLTGVPSASIFINEAPLPENLPVVPVTTPAQVLLRRPDLLQSERLVEAANEQIKINKTALRPRLSLVGSAGLISQEPGNLLSANSATYLLGASVSVPIYEGNRNRNNVLIAQHQAQAISATYQQRVLTAGREIETALANLQILSEQINSQQQALESARRTRLYAHELYVKGLTTFLEVVDAERTTLELERQAVNLKGQQAIYTISLIKAIGGSW